MRKETLNDHAERMLRVLVFIQQNLDRTLLLDEVAAVAHFSPYHFHRIFRGMVGESLQAHLRRLRLERAAGQLRYTDDSVLRIALNAGFESHAAFSRAFKALSGCSPTDWRSGATGCGLAPAPAGVRYGGTAVIDDFHPLTDGGESMEVRIVKQNPRPVAFVRHIGPYDQCGPAWEKLCQRLGREGKLAGGPEFIGLCHDDPEVTDPQKIRYDACVVVDEQYGPAGEIGVQTIPGGDYAITTHKGPLGGLKETYANLFGQWLPGSGRRTRNEPSFEIYLNDPNTTPPEDLLVDIYVPLEGR